MQSLHPWHVILLFEKWISDLEEAQKAINLV